MRQLKISKSITNRDSASIDKYLQEIGKIDLIDADEEVQLARRIKTGDTLALEKLIRSNLRFVVSVAKQYEGNGLALPDLINEGNVGLSIAAQKFDETRGFKFISYAVRWIRQSILKALSEYGKIIRLPLNKVSDINKVRKAIESLEQKNSQEPSDADLEEILEDFDISEIKEIRKLMRNGKHSSLDASFGDDDDRTLLDVTENTEIELADNLTDKSDMRADIAKYLSYLTEKQAEILKLFFGIGLDFPMTLEDIGYQYGITRERARQIKDKAMVRLQDIHHKMHAGLHITNATPDRRRSIVPPKVKPSVQKIIDDLSDKEFIPSKEVYKKEDFEIFVQDIAVFFGVSIDTVKGSEGRGTAMAILARSIAYLMGVNYFGYNYDEVDTCLHIVDITAKRRYMIKALEHQVLVDKFVGHIDKDIPVVVHTRKARESKEASVSSRSLQYDFIEKLKKKGFVPTQQLIPEGEDKKVATQKELLGFLEVIEGSEDDSLLSSATRRNLSAYISHYYGGTHIDDIKNAFNFGSIDSIRSVFQTVRNNYGWLFVKLSPWLKANDLHYKGNYKKTSSDSNPSDKKPRYDISLFEKKEFVPSVEKITQDDFDKIVLPDIAKFCEVDIADIFAIMTTEERTTGKTLFARSIACYIAHYYFKRNQAELAVLFGDKDKRYRVDNYIRKGRKYTSILQKITPWLEKSGLTTEKLSKENIISYREQKQTFLTKLETKKFVALQDIIPEDADKKETIKKEIYTFFEMRREEGDATPLPTVSQVLLRNICAYVYHYHLGVDYETLSTSLGYNDVATARILISRTGKNQANLIEKFVPWLVKNNLPYTKGKSKVTKEKITKSPLIYTKKEKANKSPLIYTKEDKKPKGSKRELFIKNKLQTPFVATTKDKPTIHILISEICNHFGVVSDAVISKGRDVELVVVRDIICYLSHVYLDYSYQSIGSTLGGRDHSTALHAVKKIIEENPDYVKPFVPWLESFGFKKRAISFDRNAASAKEDKSNKYTASMTTDSIVDAILSGDKANIQDISTWVGYDPITTSSLLLALCCKLHIGTSSIFASKEEAQLFQDFILSGLSIEDFVTSQDLERDIFDNLIQHFLSKISEYSPSATTPE